MSLTFGVGVCADWYVAGYRTPLYGPAANDPLGIIASLTGLAMGAVQPGLARQARGVALFTLVMLGIWLWLIPTILLVNESWLGLHERIVGLVYVVWLAGVSWGLLRVGRG